jgi:hypothetical protein
MNWKPWLHGLASAAIGGAATAVLAALALPPDQVCFDTLSKLASIGALLTAAGYLKQSPLPPKE